MLLHFCRQRLHISLHCFAMENPSRPVTGNPVPHLLLLLLLLLLLHFGSIRELNKWEFCPLSCHSDVKKSQSQLNHLLSDSSISLSSQPSLPSVPSLTLQHDHQPQIGAQTADHCCVSTLKGHSSAVFSLTVAGKFNYSSFSDKDIRAWPRDARGNAVHHRGSPCRRRKNTSGGGKTLHTNLARCSIQRDLKSTHEFSFAVQISLFTSFEKYFFQN